MNEPVAIGIDLGGTNLKAAIVDQNAQILACRSQRTDAGRGPKTVIADMVRLVEALLHGARLNRTDLAGVGVGCPGPLRRQDGMILRAVNLPSWENIPLRQELERGIGCSVTVENDANAATFGECWAGIGRGVDDLVMLTLGTGVGAGVVANGQIIHGHFDSAGELGHMIVDPEGLQCPCGQLGCLEQYSSASAVSRRALAAGATGLEHGRTGIAENTREPAAKDIVLAAQAGDPVCAKVWDEACLYLAIACINIQHAYDPEMIVLGGGMSAAGEFLINSISSHREQLMRRAPMHVPPIVLGALAEYAGVVGAAGIAWHQAKGRIRADATARILREDRTNGQTGLDD